MFAQLRHWFLWTMVAGGLVLTVYTEVTTQAVQGTVVVNEFLPHPLSGAPEWVELYNASSNPINVVGWMMTDGSGTSVIISSGTVLMGDPTALPPGGFLVIRLDPPMLDNSGSETIRLLALDSTVVDQVSYTGPAQGRTYARLPDGGSIWMPDANPTMGMPNASPLTPTNTASLLPTLATATSTTTSTATPTPDFTPPPDLSPTATPAVLPTFTPITVATLTPTAPPTFIPIATPTSTFMPTITPSPEPVDLVINELFAAPLVEPSEWVEIYNPTDRFVRITRWSVRRTSSTGIVKQEPLPDVTLPPFGFRFFEFLSGFLPNAGGLLVLLDEQGRRIDQVDYPALQADQSYARVPDGGATWRTDYPASPGAPNIPATPTITSTPLSTATPTPTPSPTNTATPSATASATSTPTPDPELLFMNELLAAPVSGQFEWLELYNPTDHPISLAGWVVQRTSSSGVVQRQPLPADILATSGFVAYTLPASFLPNAGASLVLVDPQGRTIDAVVYPALGTDQSYARESDGAFIWRTDYPPSPGAPNRPATPIPTSLPTATATPLPSPTPIRSATPVASLTPTRSATPTVTASATAPASSTSTTTPLSVALVVNELLAAPGSEQEEWLELYNPTAHPIALIGWVVQRTSGGGTVRRSSLPEAIVPAFGFLQSDLPASFLPNMGASLVLLDPQGRLIDAVDYPPLDINQSYARESDGDTTWRTDYPPSPGAPNRPATPTPTPSPAATATPISAPTPTRSTTPAVSLTPTRSVTPMVTASTTASASPTPTMTPLSVALVVNELLAAPGSGQAEWLELYNPTAAPIVLTGWVVQRTSSSGMVRRYPLPEAVIPAFGFLCSDLPASFLPNTGASLVLADPQGRTIDVVVYPALDTNQSYARASDGAAEWRTNYPPSPGASNAPATPTITITTSPSLTPTPTHSPTSTNSATPSITGSATPTASPTLTTTPLPVALVVNELLAAPVAEPVEWIELYNPTAHPIPLIGWVVQRTSSSGVVRRYSLPEAVVPAFGFLRSDMPASFLPNTGASLVLVDSQGRLVDAVAYPPLDSDQSYARESDGAHTWRTDYPPSPGAPNLPAPSTATASATFTVSPAPTHILVVTPSPTTHPGRLTRTSTATSLGRAVPSLTATGTATAELPASPSATTKHTATPLPSITPTALPQLLLINEVQAVPATGISEWVELYNPTSRTISMTGWTLERMSGSIIRRHTLAELALPPSSFLRYDLPRSFLPNDGASLVLIDTEGRAIDRVDYPVLATGQSYARAPDGGASWRLDYPPSPGASNQPALPTTTPSSTPTQSSTATSTPEPTPVPTFTRTATAIATPTATASPTRTATPSASTVPTSVPQQVFINEIVSSPGEDASEWIEIYNPADTPITLAGWTLQRTSGSLVRRHTLADMTLPSFGFLWYALPDGFLPNSGALLVLSDAQGRTIDSVDYPALATDQSYARAVDGEIEWRLDYPPSPGAPNRPAAEPSPSPAVPVLPAAITSTPADPPIPQPPLFRNPTPRLNAEPERPSPTRSAAPLDGSMTLNGLRINEILAAPVANASEWVELYNTTSTSITIAGWTLQRTSEGGSIRRETLQDATVAPFGFLLCEFQSGFLPNDGAGLLVVDAHGSAVDESVMYPTLSPGQSYARASDGGADWRLDYPPSPGAPNLPSPTTINVESLAINDAFSGSAATMATANPLIQSSTLVNTNSSLRSAPALPHPSTLTLPSFTQPASLRAGRVPAATPYGGVPAQLYFYDTYHASPTATMTPTPAPRASPIPAADLSVSNPPASGTAWSLWIWILICIVSCVFTVLGWRQITR